MNRGKIKSISLDVLTDVIGGFLIALGVYNFAVASDFPITGISGKDIVAKTRLATEELYKIARRSLKKAARKGI